MRSIASRLRILAICALFGLALPTLADHDPLAALALTELGGEVPAFSLRALDDGAIVDGEGLRGKLVVLHFWATWCMPCRREMPALARLANALGSAAYVVLVAIDAEASSDEVRAYVAPLHLDLPIYLAREGTIPKSFWTWGVPVTYVIDAAGRFVGRASGERAWSAPENISALRSLLPAAPLSQQ